LRVDSTSQRSPLKSLNFAALRVKDAVCDRMRDEHGERPNVDTVRPDLRIVLHVGAERAAVYVDSSGESLFKRGWREDQGDAPLKETLAAAMLAAAGWRGTPSEGGALHDPCCGSGTIAIEAAQIAMDLAPGRLRRFAFERLLPFATPERRADLQRLKSKAAARVRAPQVPIFASDVSFRMVDFARRNAERAGVAAAIVFHGGDALERPPPPLPADLPGTLMVNPPYGERIEVAGKARQGAPPRREALARHDARAPARPSGDDAHDAGPEAARRRAGERPRRAERFLPAPGSALEARLHRAPRRLDGVDPEPRHEAAERDAPEGIAPRADVERADRVPPVPLRPRRRLGARRRQGLGSARPQVGATTRRVPRERDRGQQHRERSSRG
jgi:hypothetical protein